MKIKISADSTCDLSPELIARYNIGITPLYIVRGDETLRDGIDVRPEELYAYAKATVRPFPASFPSGSSARPRR